MELSPTSTATPSIASASIAKAQRGVVLFVALIILIVMTLAGLALMRQMGAGTSIAGNIAFKESATSVSDRGIEVARNWVVAPGQDLLDDAFPSGYHSTWTGSVDPTTYDWPNESLEIADDAASTGNTTRVMIHRLCELTGLSANAPTQHCSDGINTSAGGGSRGGGGYGSGPPPTPLATPYFRITTRVEGPRKTVSYTQVLMQ
jgi:type IV pilus assembly protein PilX